MDAIATAECVIQIVMTARNRFSDVHKAALGVTMRVSAFLPLLNLRRNGRVQHRFTIARTAAIVIAALTIQIVICLAKPCMDVIREL